MMFYELIVSAMVFAEHAFPQCLWQGSAEDLNFCGCSRGAQTSQCSVFHKHACMNPHTEISFSFHPEKGLASAQK